VAIHTGDVLSFRDATSEREREREKVRREEIKERRKGKGEK
jgi:hypothetical protein